MDLKPGFGHTQQEEQHFHVLAVDDSLIDRKLLERLLTVSSYQVTCVDSGNKALEYLGLLDKKENIDSKTCSSSSLSSCPCGSSTSSHLTPQEVQGSKVNLIITDYSMPGMSGYDLLRRVKGSLWKDIPVVVMSSENVPARINMCLEGGAEEFLLKPVQLSDLRKLQSHLVKPLIDHSCENLEDDINLVDNDNNSNNSSGNKRKAMSPDCSESDQRIPKIKELAVV